MTEHTNRELRKQIMELTWHGSAKGQHTIPVEALDKIMALFDQQLANATLEASINELTVMLDGFNAGIKGKSAEFRYAMRPIIAAIERRIAQLSTQKKGDSDE